MTSKLVLYIQKSMKIMINIRIDPKMKTALEKLAEIQLVPMSTVIRQACDKHLREHGIEWREEGSQPKD